MFHRAGVNGVVVRTLKGQSSEVELWLRSFRWTAA